MMSCTALNSTTATLAVGKTRSIDLPVKSLDDFAKTLGKRINHGDVGTIFDVKDSHPQRVYKVIPLDKFDCGDEIRVSEIAGKIGVGPVVHSVFAVTQEERHYVVIEMDHAGKSLGKWMEDLAEPEPEDEETSLSPEEKAFQEMAVLLKKYP